MRSRARPRARNSALACLSGAALALGASTAAAQQPAQQPAQQRALGETEAETELPRFDAAPPVVAEAEADANEPKLREVPRDGRGMLTLGSFALLGAGAVVAGTAVLANQGTPADVWGGTVALALGATAAGTVFVIAGARRQRDYRRWAASQTEPPPIQANGLVAAGGALLIGGAASGMFGTIGWAVSDFGYSPEPTRTNPLFPALVGVGLGSLATGSVLMIVGMRRHKRFQAWRRQGPVELVPSFAPIVGRGGGFQVGLSGRL